MRLRPACAAARRRASLFELSTAHRDPGHHANAACIHGQGLQGCRRCSSIGACDLRSSLRRAAAARSAPSPATGVARAPGRWLGARRRDERVPRSARAPASRPEPRANVECGSRRALPRESPPRHRGATARTPVAEPGDRPWHSKSHVFDGRGESGVGCLGSYRPSSPPLGSRIAVNGPNPSSLGDRLNSTPLVFSSSTVA